MSEMRPAQVDIFEKQVWRHKRLASMDAIVERVSSSQVQFTFDGCLCALPKWQFRRQYVLKERTEPKS